MVSRRAAGDILNLKGTSTRFEIERDYQGATDEVEAAPADFDALLARLEADFDATLDVTHMREDT